MFFTKKKEKEFLERIDIIEAILFKKIEHVINGMRYYEQELKESVEKFSRIDSIDRRLSVLEASDSLLKSVEEHRDNGNRKLSDYFDKRTIKVLSANRIYTISDLLNRRGEDFGKFKGVGKKHVAIIKDFIEFYK